ncbi:hypothetical protein [Dactylosporangium sp. NPDC000521]|uniref:hypothetical protein n=1 Tax=Dactylosporangium sp. NPDC000521 TaxID=3363975 RepID=UPI00368CACCE
MKLHRRTVWLDGLGPRHRARRPDLRGPGASFLIVAGGKHPNDTAVYLDAATLYGILFRESPRPLANLYAAAAATATAMRDVAATAIGY